MSDVANRRFGVTSKKRRWRRIVVVSAFLLSLGPGARFLLQHYLHVDRYRPMLEAQIQDATGLPTSIGELSIVLRPLPAVFVDRIRIGEGDFAIRAKRAVIHVDLGRLMNGAFHATGVDLAELTAVAPSQWSTFRERVDALTERFAGRGGGSLRFDIDFIQARQCALYLDDATAPVFAGDLEFHDVLTLTPSGSLVGAIVTTTDTIDAEGNLRLVRGPDGGGIDAFKGSFDIEGLRLADVVNKSLLPRVALEIDGTLSGEVPRVVGIAVMGQVEPLRNSNRRTEGPHGRFSANASWDGTTFKIEDARWDEDGVRLDVEATRSESGVVSVSVPRAILGAATLRPFLAALDRDSFLITPGANGRLAIHDLFMTYSGDAGLDVQKGSVEFRDIDIDTERTGAVKSLLHQLNGRGRLAGPTIHVDEILGQGFKVSGTVTPDYAARQVSVNLKGELNVNVERLGLLFPVTSFREARGEAVIDTLTGTFGAGIDGVPSDLVVKGTVKNGALGVATISFQDDFRNIEGSFTVEAGMVTIDAQCVSVSMGSMSSSGGYAIDARSYKGTLTASVPEAVTAFLKNERALEVVPPMLEPYGRATFTVNIRLPQQRSLGSVQLSKRDAPHLEIAVSLEDRDGRTILADMEGTTTLPLSAIRHTLPDHVTASGTAPITFRRSAKERTYTADGDLTQADIQLGMYLHKRPGVAAGIRLTGEASESAWSARKLLVLVKDQPVEGIWRDGRLVFPSLDLDVERLAALLPEGATASGRITGAGAAMPASAALSLENVAVVFKPGVSIDSATGSVVYSEGRLELRNLSVVGANSELTLNLAKERDVWQGELRARQLDVNTIDATRKAAVETPSDLDNSAAPPQTRGQRFKGRISASAEKLLYRRAELHAVRATLVGDGDTITLDGFLARPRSGVATGAVVLSHSDVYPWIAEGTVHLDGVHAALVDELIFAEPREFEGSLTGSVTFRVPIPRDDRPINVASAEAEVVGKNGSLGRLGIATKVLNVLRATEIFRLRLPSLRDEGLTFDHAVFKLSMTEGVMQVREVELRRPSFAMAARGTVNFPRDDMRLDISVYPLQSITGMVEKVPLVGQAIASVRKMGPFGLRATGSPFDPKVTPEALPAWGKERSIDDAGPGATGNDQSETHDEGVNLDASKAAGQAAPAPPHSAPTPDPKKANGKGPAKEVTGAAKRVLKGILGQ